MKEKLKLFLPCYYAFLVSGAIALLVGAILPYIMEEAKINYSVAGGLLSAFAIGNFLASFVNPPLASRIGRKQTVVFLSALYPVCFLPLSFLPPIPVMYVLFILAGIARGSISILNNAYVNDNSDGKPAALNILHTVFAVGAFSAPFLTTLFIEMGFGWRGIVYTIVGASLLATIGFAFLKIDYNFPIKEKSTGKEKKDYLKNPVFYIVGFLLFFYLGVENCVNGWFVTYLKETGIMSTAFATSMVSIVWIMVMLGRLLSAKMSSKIDKVKLILVYCVATAVFFVLLVSTKNLAIITVSLAGIGFFMAGIYPNCISSTGTALKGSASGMAMLLAIAALGGIITPKIIGVVADYAGMVTAILVLSVNAAGMLLMAFLLYQRGKKDAEV